MRWVRLFRELFFGLLAACSLLPEASGQNFEARQRQDLDVLPGDLHFRLAIVNGARGFGGFHIGERIPLTLEFWSDTPDKYKLNGATYDRSGRLPTEEFVLERDDVADPYIDYFGTGVLGGIAGGLRSSPVLDAKPYKIELDLNDWFRFDRPGIYRLYLESHRLSRERGPGEPGDGTISFAAVSNLIEVRILPPDAGWEAAKLREIESVLAQPEPERPKPGGPPVPYDRTLEEGLALAHRELRYLSSPEAVRLSLVEGHRTGKGIDTFLLIGARDRSQTIAALDQYLADPQKGFRTEEIRIRALFTLLTTEAPTVLPMADWQVPAGVDVKKLWADAEARAKRFETLVRMEAIRLIPVATQKEEAARKISAQAIASIAPNEAQTARLVPPDDYGLSRAELVAQFADFPAEMQAEFLGKKWDLVRGAEMIRGLKVVVERAEAKELPLDARALNVWGSDGGLADVALRRLYELAPQEVKRVVARDLASGKPRFAGFAVREIPAFEIPEADERLSQLLRSGHSGVLPIIAKFSTAKLGGLMGERYDEGKLPCDEEASFLAYFVRMGTKGEASGAAKLLKQALADREQRGCYRFLLNQIAQVVWNPVIEAQAIASLDDSDAEMATSAVRVLAAHGGPRVEAFLWKRLQRWSESWRGRTAELEVHPITGGRPNPESQLGAALFEGIASARSWPLDESRRQDLLALCADDQCRQDWGRRRENSPLLVDVSSGGGMYPNAFRVAGYQAPTIEALKEKLGHYRAGTVFRWCPQVFNGFDAFSPGQRADMFQDVAGFLAARSMEIEPYDEAKCAPWQAIQ